MADKKPKKDFTSISIRLDKETYIGLEKVALMENRKIANVVYNFCREGIEKYCEKLKGQCPDGQR